MIQVSNWAKAHPLQARLLIIAAHIILTWLALRLGLKLFVYDIHITDSLLILFSALAVVGWLCYPTSARRQHYWRYKTCDLLLVLSTFLMCLTIGNRLPDHLAIAPSATATFTVLRPDAATNNHWGHKWKQSFKTYIQYRVATLKKQRNSVEPALFIGLTILGALLLVLLLVALSCSIACSGSETLAIVVFIFGFMGIVLLTFSVIKAINRKAKQQQPKLEPND